MRNRKHRRSLERQARKADRKAGFPDPVAAPESPIEAISALNHTIHGLARHAKGTFRLLTFEDPSPSKTPMGSKR